MEVCNDRFLALGLQPVTLEAGLMREVSEIARAYAHRADRSRIPCTSTWNAARAAAVVETVGEAPPAKLAVAD